LKTKTLAIKAINKYYSVPQKSLLTPYFEELLNALVLLSGSSNLFNEFVIQAKSSQPISLNLEEIDNELYRLGESEDIRKRAQSLLYAIKFLTSSTGQDNITSRSAPSIRAKRIKAENVVSGLQIISSENNAPQGLIGRRPIKGSISAEEIDATNIVSGVQFLSGSVPSSISEVLVELKHVNEEIKKNLSGDLGKNDLESAVNATDAEIESPSPNIETIKENLETYEHILSTSSNLFNGAQKIGGQLLSLAPIVSALIQIITKLPH
jgi:hypothetical protein